MLASMRTALALLVCLVGGTARAGEPAPRAPDAAEVVAPGPAPAPAAEVTRNSLPPNFAPPGPPRRGRLPMIVGWSAFGGTYLLTATIGIILHNSTRICDDSGESCRRPGLHLLIPVVGPLFLVRDYAETESGPLFTVFDMLFQSASLAVGIAGTVMYVRGRKRAAAGLTGVHLGRGVHLGAAPRLHGGALQLSYRF